MQDAKIKAGPVNPARLLLAALLVTISACATPAAGFSLHDTQGHDVRLSDFRGKVVLLDFWQTWCVPCAAELPQLEQMYEKLKDDGFVVIGVSMDDADTASQVAPFAQRLGLTFPVLLDSEARVARQYDPSRSAPVTILLDRGGHVFRTREGYDSGDEKRMEADVRMLLAR